MVLSKPLPSDPTVSRNHGHTVWRCCKVPPSIVPLVPATGDSMPLAEAKLPQMALADKELPWAACDPLFLRKVILVFTDDQFIPRSERS